MSFTSEQKLEVIAELLKKGFRLSCGINVLQHHQDGYYISKHVKNIFYSDNLSEAWEMFEELTK